MALGRLQMSFVLHLEVFCGACLLLRECLMMLWINLHKKVYWQDSNTLIQARVQVRSQSTCGCGACSILHLFSKRKPFSSTSVVTKFSRMTLYQCSNIQQTFILDSFDCQQKLFWVVTRSAWVVNGPDVQHMPVIQGLVVEISFELRIDCSVKKALDMFSHCSAYKGGGR